MNFILTDMKIVFKALAFMVFLSSLLSCDDRLGDSGDDIPGDTMAVRTEFPDYSGN